MNIATNSEELKHMVSPKMQNAVETLIEYFIEQNREAIEERVYSRPESDAYDRTYEFLDAFSFMPVNEAYDGDIGGAAFSYDRSKIHTIHFPYHEGTGSGKTQVDGYLIDLIYKGHGGIWNVEARNAYNDLMRSLTKPQVKMLFEAAMSKAGIPWKRSTGGITKSDVKTL